MFIIFRIVGGVGIGAASVSESSLYIGEASPTKWRGRLVSLNQLAIVFGMLLIYMVNYGIHGSGTPAWNRSVGWRWMFRFPALVRLGAPRRAAACFVVPETARFLLMHGASRKRRSGLRRAPASSTLEEILDAETQQPSHDSPLGAIVLFVGITLAVLQQVTGINVFLYYAPIIFSIE